MTSLIKSFFFPKAAKSDDFSDFFSKSAGDRVKVMKQVLKAANSEQRRVMERRAKI